MKKGFMTTLLMASLFACTVASFAYAPVVQRLPDVTIGDREDNNAATDNNWFVFTNAFQFDTFVSDQDTPKSDLKWSFDELGGSTTPWFRVNNIGAMHVGDAAIATADGTTSDAPHLNPGASDLRAASPYASFRDIVMSPTSADPGPYPAQDSATIGAHTTGRWIRFYVSDTNSVVKADALVNIADNGYDKLSGGNPFILVQRDEMTTNNAGVAGGSTGWYQFGLSTAAQSLYPSGLAGYDYDGAHTALRGKVYSSRTAALSDYRYRTAGWFCNEWLPASRVGSDNIVRAKYYLYSEPLTAGEFGNQAALPQPSLRMRVAQRFAYTQQLEIARPAYSDNSYNNWLDVKPSTNWQTPSLYRVDLFPTLVPAATAAGEGFARGFEAYCLNPEDQGYVCMAESQIGIIPKSAVAWTPLKTYNPTDLYVFDSASEVKIFNYTYAGVATPIPEGYFPPTENTITGELGTIGQDSTGITMGTLATPSAKIGVVTREFAADAQPPASPNYAIRARIKADKQYKISWHITSTRNTDVQAPINLRTRTVKFAWLSRLELGGPCAAGAANNNIAKQTLPGVGCQNPDKDGTESGGWYHSTLVSPLNADIRPEFAAGTALSVRMPHLTAEAPPSPDAGYNVTSQRDIKQAADLFDSLDTMTGYANEAGWYKIDKIIVNEADIVPDAIQ